MGKQVLIFWGGWEGHTPQQAAELVAEALRQAGAEVTVEAHLDSLGSLERLQSFDLIVPVWTCGQLDGEKTKNLASAVAGGVGLGGFHGGTGDAFRGNLEYEWLVGGLFVGHPFVGAYEVRFLPRGGAITHGLPERYLYDSEQYYMLVDPGNEVLAETSYWHQGKSVVMPVVWRKGWGRGKVFYSALGHTAEELRRHPLVLEMMVRGMLWAAR